MRRFSAAEPGFREAFDAFLRTRRGSSPDVDAAAAEIIERVRTGGLDALLELTRRFDRVELTGASLRVTSDEIAAGAAASPAEVREALAFAAARIRAYHERQRPADASWTDEAGVELGWRWTALDSVGVYVPGGRAAYPSSVLMNVVPARVAGVGRIAMVTPPGRLEPAVLAAAQVAGVDEVWRVGGAQACAALAYGAGPIAPVDKIVGPGNAYVAAAKRRLYGVVGIDSLAGPSEVLVVADGDNDPAWIAADLLAQAEHDPDAQSVLITDDADFADRVEAQVQSQLATLATEAAARASWETHGAVVVAPLQESPALVDMMAPEHVEFACEGAEALSARVRHAGAIFLGRSTPEAVGDYVGRFEPCAADQPLGAVLVGTVDLRLPEAHLDPALLRTSLRRPRPRHRYAGRRRGAARPRPLRGAAAWARPRPRPRPRPERSGLMAEPRLRTVEIDEASLGAANREQEHEREVAVFDLLEENHFQPEGADGGPYDLRLSLVDGRLAFDIGGDHYDPKRHLLSLTPLRSIIKDYFLVCGSYYEAIRNATPAQIEALDMGRRGLHNDGSEILRERLQGKVEIDRHTARRLFTLVCALHWRG